MNTNRRDFLHHAAGIAVLPAATSIPEPTPDPFRLEHVVGVHTGLDKSFGVWSHPFQTVPYTRIHNDITSSENDLTLSIVRLTKNDCLVSKRTCTQDQWLHLSVFLISLGADNYNWTGKLTTSDLPEAQQYIKDTSGRGKANTFVISEKNAHKFSKTFCWQRGLRKIVVPDSTIQSYSDFALLGYVGVFKYDAGMILAVAPESTNNQIAGTLYAKNLAKYWIRLPI